MSLSALLRLGSSIADEAERVRVRHGTGRGTAEEARRSREGDKRRSLTHLMQAASDCGLVDPADLPHSQLARRKEKGFPSCG